MPRTKTPSAPADAQQEIIVPESAVKQDGITLNVTVTEEEYKQILHTVEVAGYRDVDEWLSAAVHNAM